MMSLRFGILLALYFVAEALFAGMAKTLHDPLGMLPTAVSTAALAWWSYVVLSGQWDHVRVTRDAVVAAAGSACILLSLSIAYSLPGVTIILPLLLMKGGGQLVAPTVSAVQGERVSGRALGVLALVLAGVVAALWSRLSVDGTAGALCCAAVYLGGYGAKLGAFGRHRGDWPFFVSVTTLTLAISIPASFLICAVGGAHPSGDTLAYLAGLASQGCGVFGGAVLLRGTAPEDVRRGLTSHAALFPVHRSTSLLAGMTATVGLAVLRWGPAGTWAAAVRGDVLSWGEFAGALCMLVALWVGTRTTDTVSAWPNSIQTSAA